MTLCVFISALNDLLPMLPPEFLSEDELIISTAAEILEKHKAAFLELAK